MWIRFLIVLALILLAEYYSFVVVRSALRTLPGGWRTGLLITYIALSLLVWSGFIFFRVIDWSALPHFARNVYIAFSIGFMVGKVLILVVMLFDDLRRLVMWLISLFSGAGAKPEAAGKGITRSVFMQRFAMILGGGALLGFLYGIRNRYNYHIRRVTIPLAGLPEAFRGLKIVQLSDIHSGSFDEETAVMRGIQMALNEKPDLILFTGDLVNNKAEEIEPYKHLFSQLKAPLGVYSTLGNHDYGDYVQWDSPEAKRANLERLKQHHADMGWRLLMNEHVFIEKDGQRMALLGIENWSAKAQFPKYGDMRAAYNGLSKDDGLVKILMSHDPSHWDAQVRPQYPDVQLTLSGHTHGMQCGIEIPGFKWSPVQYLYSKWAGLYEGARQHLYVNRGYGFLGYPGRLGILPEITVLELA